MIVVFITCKNNQEASAIAKSLLEKKLVACAKITNEVSSHYFWPPKSGTIETTTEVLLICETNEEKWNDIEKTVSELSSYDTPSLFALPVSSVSNKYLTWLKEELK